MEATEVLISIRKIVRSINLESKKIEKEYGVSIPQVLCLNFLSQSPDYQATQAEIRRFLNLNSSTVSGIINRLEKKGFIARLPKSGDRRVTTISLTATGDKLQSRLPSLLHEQLSKKLEKMEAIKLQQIEDSLELLVQILNIQGLEASPMITLDDDLEDPVKSD